ncbi:hypothetical protein [Pigmentiphaga litoralis]|uniref:hypothetical protein n=1 Tax=Pigmentiphaga litoralis TaxID=516702 RepID=UPI003B4390B3
MTQKTTALTPEESAIANRDLKGQTAGTTVSTTPVTGTTPVGTTPVTGAQNHPRTHASAEPGDPNIEEDATLPHAGSPFKDINRGNRSSMDE